jgi:putative two-component system response regulator
MTDEPEIHDVTVLVVDDEDSVREVVAASLGCDKHIVVVGTAKNGDEAIKQAHELSPDVVVMDVNMPVVDGCDACTEILRDHPDTRIVALTGNTDSEHVTKMILAGAVGYAVKGSDPNALCDVVHTAYDSGRFIDAAAVPGLFDSVLQLARDERARRHEAEALADDLQRSYEETVKALVTALRSRDNATEEHGDRVAGRVRLVGEALGLDEARLTDLEYGAMFHDIGKIGVPDAILHNTDELTPDEWRVIKQHTVMGENIIRPVGFLKDVAKIVRHSHEHWDGTGYPDGLAGEDIPLESRIIFACDAFDAMTSERTYQEALSRDRAIDRMHELSGTRFDPRVVEAVLGVLAAEPPHDLAV